MNNSGWCQPGNHSSSLQSLFRLSLSQIDEKGYRFSGLHFHQCFRDINGAVYRILLQNVYQSRFENALICDSRYSRT
jgi:hypothetical protein